SLNNYADICRVSRISSFLALGAPGWMCAYRRGTMPLRILLVHRHSLVLHALKALVEGHGVQVVGHSNRDEAGRIAESVRHDVANVMLQPVFGKNHGRRPDGLTDRERQVVSLVAEGNSTKEVAARLGISVKTADCHRTRIMNKLNVHETANLVRYAVREGLVQ